jgi:hypothetical protein
MFVLVLLSVICFDMLCCDEELRARTDLPDRRVAILQQLSYSLDIYVLSAAPSVARRIVTALCDPFVSMFTITGRSAWLSSHGPSAPC